MLVYDSRLRFFPYPTPVTSIEPGTRCFGKKPGFEPATFPLSPLLGTACLCKPARVGRQAVRSRVRIPPRRPRRLRGPRFDPGCVPARVQIPGQWVPSSIPPKGLAPRPLTKTMLTLPLPYPTPCPENQPYPYLASSTTLPYPRMHATPHSGNAPRRRACWCMTAACAFSPTLPYGHSGNRTCHCHTLTPKHVVCVCVCVCVCVLSFRDSNRPPFRCRPCWEQLARASPQGQAGRQLGHGFESLPADLAG